MPRDEIEMDIDDLQFSMDIEDDPIDELLKQIKIRDSLKKEKK